MSTEPKPLVSIITATCNEQNQLAPYLTGLHKINKHRAGFECEFIFIDGASQDETASVIEDSDFIDVWLSEPDRGIYDAWNKGISRARGDWLCFLGVGDELDSENWNRMLTQLRSVDSSLYKIVYSDLTVRSKNNEVLEVIGRPWDRVKNLFFQEMCIPHVGTFHHRSVFTEFDNFDASFQIAGDYELLLRVLKKYSALYIPKLGYASMLQGGISTSGENNQTVIDESNRAKIKNGISLKLRYWGDLPRSLIKMRLKKFLPNPLFNLVVIIYRRGIRRLLRRKNP